MRSLLYVLVCCAICSTFVLDARAQDALVDPASLGYVRKAEIRQYPLTSVQLNPALTMTAGADGRSMQLDLADTTIYGRVYFGPAFSSTSNPNPRWRFSTAITQGRAAIYPSGLFDETTVPIRHGDVTAAYRLEVVKLDNGKPLPVSFFDSRVAVRRDGEQYRPILTVTDGPVVSMVTSEHPDSIVVAFTADRPAFGAVEVEGAGIFTSGARGIRHEISVRGLKPSTVYAYRVLAWASGDTSALPYVKMKTAPPPGSSPITFLYAGDSRQSAGGGEHGFVGVNRAVMGEIARAASAADAGFMLFGGDAIGGYTASEDEFRMQMRAFHQSVQGFLTGRPIYAGIGNHEALLEFYEDSSRRGLGVDRRPYHSVSTEAVFGDMVVHPRNGPAPQEGLPPYSETVYSFQYGNVFVIVMNNNYWWTSHNRIREVGGSPEGYFLPEQIDWLREQLDRATMDPTIAHALIFAHEPFFPNGGHLGDAMWHNGNNNVRAVRLINTALVPFGSGIIEVRNRVWKMLSSCEKVTVVLGSDEHNYQRSVITERTSVGVPGTDDLDGDGILNDGRYSADTSFSRPLTYIVSGGAGAPYYQRDPSPWSEALDVFSAENHYVSFRSESDTLWLKAVSLSDEVLDSVTIVRRP